MVIGFYFLVVGLYILYESLDLGGVAGWVGMLAGPFLVLMACGRFIIGA